MRGWHSGVRRSVATQQRLHLFRLRNIERRSAALKAKTTTRKLHRATHRRRCWDAQRLSPPSTRRAPAVAWRTRDGLWPQPSEAKCSTTAMQAGEREASAVNLFRHLTERTASFSSTLPPASSRRRSAAASSRLAAQWRKGSTKCGLLAAARSRAHISSSVAMEYGVWPEPFWIREKRRMSEMRRTTHTFAGYLHLCRCRCAAIQQEPGALQLAAPDSDMQRRKASLRAAQRVAFREFRARYYSLCLSPTPPHRAPAAARRC